MVIIYIANKNKCKNILKWLWKQAISFFNEQVQAERDRQVGFLATFVCYFI